MSIALLIKKKLKIEGRHKKTAVYLGVCLRLALIVKEPNVDFVKAM